MSRVDELVTAWVDGSLSDEESAELRRLTATPEGRRSFEASCGLERSLYRCHRGEEGIEGLIPVERGAPSLWLVGGGVLLAAVVLVAVSWAIWSPVGSPEAETSDPVAAPEPSPPLVPASADATRSPDGVAAGPRLRRDGGWMLAPAGALLATGDRVATDVAAGITLRLPGGGTADLGPATELVVAEDRLHVEAGLVELTIPPRQAGAPLLVETPHAMATVLGTRFLVQAGEHGSLLRVDEGLVGWRPADGSADATVTAGETATAGAVIARQTLLGWRFADGTADPLGMHGPAPDLLGLDAGEFLPGEGVLVQRQDHITWQTYAGQPPFVLAALQDAQAVELAVLVRFATDIPQRLSLATLVCMEAPESAGRFVDLRWMGGPQAAGAPWYRVTVTVYRDGLWRYAIDGRVVHERAATWPFAAWSGALGGLIHTHRDPPLVPRDVVYQDLRLVVLGAPPLAVYQTEEQGVEAAE